MKIFQTSNLSPFLWRRRKREHSIPNCSVLLLLISQKGLCRAHPSSCKMITCFWVCTPFLPTRVSWVQLWQFFFSVASASEKAFSKPITVLASISWAFLTDCKKQSFCSSLWGYCSPWDTFQSVGAVPPALWASAVQPFNRCQRVAFHWCGEA